ncbi:DUF4913 domain-containing protein [Cellulomonas sp.]|uniref:DUF4913 domain-containing protein n=1 Tax=Cellulomonas sp. TaxID=40001 RepID=UPI001B28F2AA|nr:DUF4913 domain-containing protein [Cellulomonas sp.]MBO9553831.1 DUF4913 domain-containing protein [Cellulomonas sp.]
MTYDADADWAAVDGQLLGTPVTPGLDGALHFGSVDEFVRDYLRHVYKRRVDGRSRCWAAEWWRSEEAVVRLEALWRSWEALRLDAATGMSEWFRDHADYHMGVLLDPDGPFAGATGDADTCRRGDPLPYAAPPEAMFPDVRVAT